MEHCLSFDVEEYFQVSAFESPMRRSHWDMFESRVERNTSKLLELLTSYNVKATFFILGWVAERYPHLVRQIASAGHEIASHGYGHHLITNQTPAAFREDVRKAKIILEDISSHSVLGYRAPSFSITQHTVWALSILVEEGYLYDSSIFPILHDRYGIPSAIPSVNLIKTEAGDLWEVPLSVANFMGLNLPVAGGGYFRLYPYPLLRWLLRRIERKRIPLIMYLHPWEFDPYQPRMNGPLLSRIRHYLNLSKSESKLKRLLEDFNFAPICEAIESVRYSKRRPSSAGNPAHVCTRKTCQSIIMLKTR